MNSITLPPDEDCGDWHAKARLRVESAATIALVPVCEWGSDGVEPDDVSANVAVRARD